MNSISKFCMNGKLNYLQSYIVYSSYFIFVLLINRDCIVVAPKKRTFLAEQIHISKSVQATNQSRTKK